MKGMKKNGYKSNYASNKSIAMKTFAKMANRNKPTLKMGK